MASVTVLQTAVVVDAVLLMMDKWYAPPPDDIIIKLPLGSIRAPNIFALPSGETGAIVPMVVVTLVLRLTE